MKFRKISNVVMKKNPIFLSHFNYCWIVEMQAIELYLFSKHLHNPEIRLGTILTPTIFKYLFHG